MPFQKTFVPDFVTSDRVAEWEASQPTPPRFSIVRVLRHEASNSCDWLKLYALRYVSTKGYTHPGILRYDLTGGTEFYITPSVGCRAALNIERKNKDTTRPLPEAAAKVYSAVWSFCKEKELEKARRVETNVGLLTKSPAPEAVTPLKLLDFEEITPLREGVTSITYMEGFAKHKKANWVLFYAWCYVRTKGFRDSCMARRDIGNSGKTFEALTDGIKDAVTAFLSYPSTAYMDECVSVELLYTKIQEFCTTSVYDSPQAEEGAVPEKKVAPPVEILPAPIAPKAPSWMTSRWALAAYAAASIILGFLLQKILGGR